MESQLMSDEATFKRVQERLFFCGVLFEMQPAPDSQKYHGSKKVNLPNKDTKKLKPQKEINDEEFSQALQGYVRIKDNTELFDLPLGGRVRYVTDVFDKDGGHKERRYRYGGVLIKVDSSLRYIMLKNPTLAGNNNVRGTRSTWSVQLKDPLQQTTLYYCQPLQSSDASKYRQLLNDIETGKLVVNKN